MLMAKTDDILSEIKRILDKKKEIHKKDILEKFPQQSPLVSYVLHKAVQEGQLIKLGSTRGARYVWAQTRETKGLISKTYRRGEQSEEEIFLLIIRG